MGNVVDAIPFEGECCFHPILHHICHVTRLSSTFTPTSNSDSSINHSSIHLIYCNRARLDLRIQQFASHLLINKDSVGKYSFHVSRA